MANGSVVAFNVCKRIVNEMLCLHEVLVISTDGTESSPLTG